MAVKTKVKTKIKQLSIKDVVRGCMGEFDGLIDIEDLEFLDENLEMYGDYDTEHIKDIQNSIKLHGLKVPISLYKDGKSVKYGVNRSYAVKGLGITQIPYKLTNENKPKDALSVMISLAIGNMGRRANMARAYRSVQIMAEKYSQSNNMRPCGTQYIREYCGYHQITQKSFSRLSTLENTAKYTHLFDKVMAGNQSLNSAWGEKTIIDRLGSGTTMKTSPIMNGLIDEVEISFAIAQVASVQSQMSDLTVRTPAGEEVPAFKDFQKNILGGVVHEIFTNAVMMIVNDRTGKPTLVAPKTQSLYDLEALIHNSGIEVKTCVTNHNKKPQFAGHRYKDGYHLLLSITPNGNRVFAGYGIITADCWKKGGVGMPGHLDLEKVLNLKSFVVLRGELELENGKVIVNHDPITA